MRTISERDHNYLDEAVDTFLKAKKVVALTGAGVSVESGIADFRSPGGLWSRFAPEEYGTIDVFRNTPHKAWKLYRSLGKELVGKKPNPGHFALALLEQSAKLAGIVTQNIDNLHQLAGSKRVIEIHGEHGRLQCIRCGNLQSIEEFHLEETTVPQCSCGAYLKPNVVLFGENVRDLDKIDDLLYKCDLLLVAGTSAQVYPAAGLPDQIKQLGGLIYEFNKEETALTTGARSGRAQTDYFFNGRSGKLLKLFTDQIIAKL